MGMQRLMQWLIRGMLVGLVLVILAGCRVRVNVDVEGWESTPSSAYPSPAPAKPLLFPTMTPSAYPVPPAYPAPQRPL